MNPVASIFDRFVALRLLAVGTLLSAVATATGQEMDATDSPSAVSAPPSNFNDDLPDELQGVDIVEHLNDQLPLDLEFTNEEGQSVKLGDIIDGTRPAVLQMGYYRCPMLCDLVLNEAMKGLGGVE